MDNFIAWLDRINSIRLFTWILFAVSTITLLSFAVLSPFNRYLADDFCFASKVDSLGFWGSQIDWYNSWTGRFSSSFLSSLTTLIGSWTAAITPLLVTLVWPGLLSVLVRQLISVRGTTLSWTQAWTIGALLVSAYLIIVPMLTQSVYWQIGMLTYSLPFVLLTLLAVCVLFRAHRLPAVKVAAKTTPAKATTAALVSICSSLLMGFSETTLLFIAGVTFALAAYYWLHKEAPHRQFLLPLLIISLISMVVGALFSILAPGNALRSSSLGVSTPSIPWVIKMTLVSSSWLLKSTILTHWMTFLTLTGLAAATAYARQPQRQTASDGSLRALLIRCFLGLLACGLVIAITFAPSLYATHWPPAYRAVTPVIISLIVYSILAGYHFGKYIHGHGWQINTQIPWSLKSRLFTTILLASLSTYPFISQAFYNFNQLPIHIQYAREWDERHAYILEQVSTGAVDVEIRALGRTGGLEDVSPGDHWVNSCVAKWYGASSIRAPRLEGN